MIWFKAFKMVNFALNTICIALVKTKLESFYEIYWQTDSDFESVESVYFR